MRDNKEKKMTNTIEITARAKAFSGEGVREHMFRVDEHGVAVWDSVAGYFTTVNILSASAKKRIAKLSMDA